MLAFATGIITFCKGISALNDLLEQVVTLYIQQSKDSLDQSAAEQKKDIEYVTALKQQAIKDRDDEKVIRAHRLWIATLANNHRL